MVRTLWLFDVLGMTNSAVYRFQYFCSMTVKSVKEKKKARTGSGLRLIEQTDTLQVVYRHCFADTWANEGALVCLRGDIHTCARETCDANKV